MEELKKGRRGFETSDKDAASDRLRDLPEPILQHILALLPYRSAIATSLFSSHWRHLWEQRWPHPSSLHFLDADRDPKALVADINRQIKLNPSPRRLDSLTISFHPLTSHLAHIRKWMKYACECGVADLRLDLHSNPPKFIFRCDSPSLVRLTLTSVHITRVSRYRNLTSLEVLSLHQVTISNEAMKNLIASCPTLRVLELHRCRDLVSFITLSTVYHITTLRIFDCQMITSFVVTVPKLRCLYLRNVRLRHMGFMLSVLEDVYMSWGDMPVMKQLYWHPTEVFTHVHFLTIGGIPFEHLATHELPLALDKLRELQILMEEMTLYQLHIIYKFLQNVLCPSLERLFIELPPFANIEMIWTLEEGEPPRLEGVTFQHLRIIKIKNFHGVSAEVHLVKFLLKKATCLESMIIVAADVATRVSTYHNYDNADDISVLRQHLEFLPKSSTNATLSLNELDDDQVQPRHHEVHNASCSDFF